MAALARYALGSKAALLERAAEPKRTAMLTAVMRHLEVKAIDEALDLFQVLMALPAETYPHTTRHAAELTAGEGHDRFDFTLAFMIDGLAHR
ncbi:hypothetical protein GCM10009577_46820 [Streptomyces javensis]